MAAEVVVAARGRHGRQDLEPYRRRLEARFGRARAAPALPIPAGLVEAAGRRLFRARWFARRVVLDRWFLHVGEPALELAAQ